MPNLQFIKQNSILKQIEYKRKFREELQTIMMQIRADQKPSQP